MAGRRLNELSCDIAILQSWWPYWINGLAPIVRYISWDTVWHIRSMYIYKVRQKCSMWSACICRFVAIASNYATPAVLAVFWSRRRGFWTPVALPAGAITFCQGASGTNALLNKAHVHRGTFRKYQNLVRCWLEAQQRSFLLSIQSGWTRKVAVLKKWWFDWLITSGLHQASIQETQGALSSIPFETFCALSRGHVQCKQAVKLECISNQKQCASWKPCIIVRLKWREKWEDIWMLC